MSYPERHPDNDRMYRRPKQWKNLKKLFHDKCETHKLLLQLEGLGCCPRMSLIGALKMYLAATTRERFYAMYPEERPAPEQQEKPKLPPEPTSSTLAEVHIGSNLWQFTLIEGRIFDQHREECTALAHHDRAECWISSLLSERERAQTIADAIASIAGKTEWKEPVGKSGGRAGR